MNQLEQFASRGLKAAGQKLKAETLKAEIGSLTDAASRGGAHTPGSGAALVGAAPASLGRQLKDGVRQKLKAEMLKAESGEAARCVARCPKCREALDRVGNCPTPACKEAL